MLTADRVCLLVLVIGIASAAVNAKSTKGRELYKKVALPQPAGWMSRCINGHTLTITACENQDGGASQEADDDTTHQDSELFSEEMKEQSYEDKHSKLTEATSADNQLPRPDGWVSRCFNGYTVTITACEGGESKEGDGEIEGDLFSSEIKSWNEGEQRKNMKHKKVPSEKNDSV